MGQINEKAMSHKTASVEVSLLSVIKVMSVYDKEQTCIKWAVERVLVYKMELYLLHFLIINLNEYLDHFNLTFLGKTTDIIIQNLGLK